MNTQLNAFTENNQDLPLFSHTPHAVPERSVVEPVTVSAYEIPLWDAPEPESNIEAMQLFSDLDEDNLPDAAYLFDPEAKCATEQTEAEFIAACQFCKYQGQRRLWIANRVSLYTVKDQKNGKLTRNASDILTELYNHLHKGF